jgi:hypothetical protein
MYKYKEGDKFTIIYNNITYYGTIIKIADLNEFGADFYFDEKNYVVNFNIDNLPIATYNFSNKDCTFKYVMTESDIK